MSEPPLCVVERWPPLAPESGGDRDRDRPGPNSPSPAHPLACKRPGLTQGGRAEGWASPVTHGHPRTPRCPRPRGCLAAGAERAEQQLPGDQPGCLRAAPFPGERLRLQPPSSRHLLLLPFLLPSPPLQSMHSPGLASPAPRRAGETVLPASPAAAAPRAARGSPSAPPAAPAGVFAPAEDEAADAAAGAVSAGGALARRPPPLLLRGAEEVGGAGARGTHAGGEEGAAGPRLLRRDLGAMPPPPPGEEVPGGFRDPHPIAFPFKFGTGPVPLRRGWGGDTGALSVPTPRAWFSPSPPSAWSRTAAAPAALPRPRFTGSAPAAGAAGGTGPLSRHQLGASQAPGSGGAVLPKGTKRVVRVTGGEPAAPFPLGHAVLPGSALKEEGSVLPGLTGPEGSTLAWSVFGVCGLGEPG